MLGFTLWQTWQFFIQNGRLDMLDILKVSSLFGNSYISQHQQQAPFSNIRISACKTHCKAANHRWNITNPKSNATFNDNYNHYRIYAPWRLIRSYLQEIRLHERALLVTTCQRTVYEKKRPTWNWTLRKQTSKWEKRHPTHLNMPQEICATSRTGPASNWWVVLLHHAARSWKVWPQWLRSCAFAQVVSCFIGILVVHRRYCPLRLRLFWGSYLNQGL